MVKLIIHGMLFDNSALFDGFAKRFHKTVGAMPIGLSPTVLNILELLENLIAVNYE